MVIEVHAEKQNCDQFECGFCDYAATNIKAMELETSNLPDKMQRVMTKNCIPLFPYFLN